ncbi:MAG: endopeptidase La [Candidatus Pacebacteria bacterium]|nr:endopeptidase La [Candidatus Paceibacterota bacterium]
MALLLGKNKSDLKDSSKKRGRQKISSNHFSDLPLVPVRGTVIFPHTELALTFGRPRSIAAVEAASKKNNLLCLVSQKDAQIDRPGEKDLYSIGTLAKIIRLYPAEEAVYALVKGLSRVEIREFTQDQPFFRVKVKILPEILTADNETQALAAYLKRSFRKAVNLGKSVELTTVMKLMTSEIDLSELADQIALALDVSTEEKQVLLETLQVKKRLEKVVSLISHELKVLRLEQKIATKTKDKFEKSAREAMLRERKKVIEKELGEADEEEQETKELRLKIRKAMMPREVVVKAKKELKRLSRLSPNHPEKGYIRTYLDWLVELPWSKSTPNKTRIEKAAKILDEDHYGLDKIKERIIEYLAVMKLKSRNETGKQSKQVKKKLSSGQRKEVGGPTILCFVGPPGVGKTSIGKSIARALGRKFVRMSLGGIRDEAEIRGHRRTYVGAMPGRIIQGIKNVGTRNPVFMLDEIDKVGADFRGDPSAALLEALDPEQNFEFSDHYLEVPFDLTGVMFITTANVLHTIPPALRDRMEVIRFPGYTEDEKFFIAKKFLWTKQLKANGLGEKEVAILDEVLKEIISRYTREAGVRDLERNLAAICRKLARKTAEGKKMIKAVARTDMRKFLGPTKFTPVLAEKKDEVGMATGLAYTEAGGDVLFIEVALMPGKGSLLLTGKLGKVMKESAKAAFSYVRSRWQELGLKKDFYKSLDIHIHVPEGATPKDGPSAGIAIASALISAFTKQPTFKDVGLTGEITLRGRVLEVGGIKEKVIAAHRAGLKTVILPKENKKDLEDVPKKVLKDIKFIYVSHMDQVLKVAIKPASKTSRQSPAN